MGFAASFFGWAVGRFNDDFCFLSKLRADSNSTMSNEGTSKAGRLGRLLKLFARWAAAATAAADELAGESGALGRADSRSGVECER